MAYQLWNLATGNAIAEYETEAEALALVRETVQEYGRHEAMAWALTADDENTVTEPIAEGEALIDRSFTASGQHADSRDSPRVEGEVMAKTWTELTGRQRGLLSAAALVQLALLAIALRDLRRRPANQIRGPKLLWVAATFVNYIGPLAYLAVGRRR